MKLDLTIREKLVIFYVALGFIAVSVLGIYSFLSARDAILSRSFEQLTSVREVKKARLEHFFADREREIEYMSQSIHHSYDMQIQSGTQSQFTDVLGFLKGAGYYSSLFILTDQGIPTYTKFFFDCSECDTMYDSLFVHVYDQVMNLGKTQFFEYTQPQDSSLVLIATPVSHLPKTVLVLGIHLSAINQIMLETNSFGGLGASGESYLVAKDLYMRSSSRFIEDAPYKQKVNTVAVHHAFAQASGTELVKDYRGIDVLSSYSSIEIPNIHWAILAEIDLKEVMIPVYTIRNDIILMSGLIILIVSIVAFIISLKITTPLLKLRTVAMEIAKGKYGKTIAIESRDEVGELTESFNHMSTQIYEQTKELREREKRLHHFYQATTDGIILHKRGKILLTNQAVEKMTQYSLSEILNMHVTQIVPYNQVDAIQRHPEKQYISETNCIRKDGASFPVELIENPIEFDGNVVSAIVIRDISERVEIQHKLDEERKKRLTSFIDGQEDERKRLSRELHDGLGQSLVGIKLRLETLKLQQDEKNMETLVLVKSFVEQTILDVRRVSNNLMPSVLRDIGLKLAIQKLCDETERNSGIAISFDAETVTKIPNDRVKSYLYRITQEAIHNAVKHSKATEMSIMLAQEPTKVRLIIEDNGVGFDEDTLEIRGNGLYSMQERVAILNGNITIASSPGKGVYIDVRLPLE